MENAGTDETHLYSDLNLKTTVLYKNFLIMIYMSQAIEEIRHFQNCLGNWGKPRHFRKCLGNLGNLNLTIFEHNIISRKTKLCVCACVCCVWCVYDVGVYGIGKFKKKHFNKDSSVLEALS